MEISYNNNAIKKLCENSGLADRKKGKPCAKSLRTRLSDIGAASNVGDLRFGKPHPLKEGSLKGKFALRLDEANRLVFEPANEPALKLEDGSVDWNGVTKVKIVFIGDYHG